MSNMIQKTGKGLFAVEGEANAKVFALVLIEHSFWFTMTPIPCDRWKFETRGDLDSALVEAFSTRLANGVAFSQTAVQAMNESQVYVDTASKDDAGTYVLRGMHTGTYIARVTPAIDRHGLLELLACARRHFDQGVELGEKNIRTAARQLFGVAA